MTFNNPPVLDSTLPSPLPRPPLNPSFRIHGSHGLHKPQARHSLNATRRFHVPAGNGRNSKPVPTPCSPSPAIDDGTMPSPVTLPRKRISRLDHLRSNCVPQFKGIACQGVAVAEYSQATLRALVNVWPILPHVWIAGYEDVRGGCSSCCC